MRSDAVANREKIVDAARELFAERGVEVDVREICERAGVGMGTLYRHFPTKDDLVDEVVFELAQALTDIMDRFDRREGDVRPLVEWLAFHEEWGQIGRMVHDRFKRAPASDDSAQDVSRRDYFAYQRKRRLGQWESIRDAGAVRTDIPVEFMMEASDGLLGMYFELRERWGPEQARKWVVSIFEQGVRPRSERPAPWSEVRPPGGI